MTVDAGVRPAPSSDDLQATIARVTAGWSEAQRSALYHRLQREATRERISQECNTAGKLAKLLDPSTVQTPALDCIDEHLEWALHTRDARLIITIPPQEGKSTRVAVFGSLRALQLDPDRAVVGVSFSEDLIKDHARNARNLVNQNGSNARDPITGLHLPDKLGLALGADKSSAGHWTVEGHKGGMYVAGIEGGVTGRRADLLIIDDPFKGMEEADSATLRAKVVKFWQSTALTRLSPGAPVILVQTRWHEKDLAGYLLDQDQARPAERRRWRLVNIPAYADGKTPDALNRPAGTWLQSARGRTEQDWRDKEEDVGPRAWNALYQGRPTPLRGGLFSSDWFDRYRIPNSDGAVVRIVSIDPAETGKNDEAGLVAMAGTDDGRALLVDDWSAHMTSDVWARRAVVLALTTGATEVMFEAYTTTQTYRRTIVDAWRIVRDQARILRHFHARVGPENAHALAVEYLSQSEDAPADLADQLLELEGVAVPDQTTPPFLIHPHRGKGDKTARATGARQAASTGKLRMVGTHPEFESQATTWQAGQPSPDRMDAVVNGYNRLQELGGTSGIAIPSNDQPAEASGVSGSLAQMFATPMNLTDRG